MMSIIFAIGLFYRHGYLKHLRPDAVDSVATATSIGISTENTKRGLVNNIVDNTCSLLVSAELLSLPMMVLYLISPYQTFNCVFGLIVGIVCIKVIHGRIFELMRVWVWFITFNLSLVSITVIKALSR